MAWSSGKITFADCTHAVGIADWDKLWVGASTYCPACKQQRTVAHMSRVREATPSRDAQLGIRGGEADGPKAGATDVAPDIDVRDRGGE